MYFQVQLNLCLDCWKLCCMELWKWKRENRALRKLKRIGNMKILIRKSTGSFISHKNHQISEFEKSYFLRFLDLPPKKKSKPRTQYELKIYNKYVKRILTSPVQSIFQSCTANLDLLTLPRNFILTKSLAVSPPLSFLGCFLAHTPCFPHQTSEKHGGR